MIDLTPKDDRCRVCGAEKGEKHGQYKQFMGDFGGIPSWETIDCEYEERPVGLGKHIKCACGWEGTESDMIAEWSDIEPHCPECWNSRDFEEE